MAVAGTAEMDDLVLEDDLEEAVLVDADALPSALRWRSDPVSAALWLAVAHLALAVMLVGPYSPAQLLLRLAVFYVGGSYAYTLVAKRLKFPVTLRVYVARTPTLATRLRVEEALRGAADLLAWKDRSRSSLALGVLVGAALVFSLLPMTWTLYVLFLALFAAAQ